MTEAQDAVVKLSCSQDLVQISSRYAACVPKLHAVVPSSSLEAMTDQLGKLRNALLLHKDTGSVLQPLLTGLMGLLVQKQPSPSGRQRAKAAALTPKAGPSAAAGGPQGGQIKGMELEGQKGEMLFVKVQDVVVMQVFGTLEVKDPATFHVERNSCTLHVWVFRAESFIDGDTLEARFYYNSSHDLGDSLRLRRKSEVLYLSRISNIVRIIPPKEMLESLPGTVVKQIVQALETQT